MSGPKDEKARLAQRKREELERKRREEEQRRVRVRALHNQIADQTNAISSLSDQITQKLEAVRKTAKLYGFQSPSMVEDFDYKSKIKQIITQNDNKSDDELELNRQLENLKDFTKALNNEQTEIMQHGLDVIETKRNIKEEENILEKVSTVIDNQINELKEYGHEIKVELPANLDVSSNVQYSKDYIAKLDLSTDNLTTLQGMIDSLRKEQSQVRAKTDNLKKARVEMTEKYGENLLSEIATLNVAESLAKDKLKDEQKKKEQELQKQLEEIEAAKQKQEKINKLREKVQGDLNAVKGMYLSNELRDQLANITQSIYEINDLDYLRNFNSITIVPYIKECKNINAQYEELNAKYNELRANYEILCDDLGIVPRTFACVKDSIIFLESEILRLRELAQERNAQKYINEQLDEIMKELGYTVLGANKDKREGFVQDQLYRYNETTAIRLTYTEDQDLCVEIGSMDQKDRDPNLAEAKALEQDMKTFCGDFAKFKQKCAERGIELSKISELEPDAKYAQVHNLNDYEIEESVKQEILTKMEEVQQAAEKRKALHLDQE